MIADALVRRGATVVAGMMVVAVVATAAAVLVPSVRDRVLGADDTPAYAVGDPSGLEPELYSGSVRTLVLFARSSCVFCQQARPVLIEAIALAGQQPDLVVVLATTGRNRADEIAYALDLGLAATQVYAVAASDLRLRKVPSVAIVDPAGRVQFFQETLATPEARAHVLEAIRPH